MSVICYRLIKRSINRRSFVPLSRISRNSSWNSIGGSFDSWKTSRPFLPIAHLNFHSSSIEQSCWNCSFSEKDLGTFCPQCNSILPLDKNLNYFQILGINQHYDIDEKKLRNLFKKLQGLFHPDKFSIKSKKEQNLSEEHSSMINSAFKCLVHPVSRAEYLLQLAGKPIDEGEITMDTEFLMEIMEVNERLAEASDKDTIGEISKLNNQIMDNLQQQANAFFSSDEIDSAREVVARMKYYNNIYQKVKTQELKYKIVH